MFCRSENKEAPARWLEEDLESEEKHQSDVEVEEIEGEDPLELSDEGNNGEPGRFVIPLLSKRKQASRESSRKVGGNGSGDGANGGNGSGSGTSSNQKWEKVCKPAEFPKGLSPAEQLSAWTSWKRQFSIAMDMMKVQQHSQRAQLLYLYVGDELRVVIEAYKMMPEGSSHEGSSDHCDELMKKLDKFFKSTTDETIDMETLWAAKQRSAETARAFLTRIMQQAERCNITDMKIVRTNFLRGMKDQTVASTAIAGEWDTDKIVKAAARSEALNPSVLRPIGETKPEPVEVYAVASGERERRDSWRGRGKGRWQSRWQNNSRGSNRPPWGGRNNLKPCVACGLQSHRLGTCPAVGKPCLTCGLQA